MHHGPNAGALSNAQRVDRSPQPTSVEVTGPFAVPARTRVVCVSSVPPLLVVVGYWRLGAVPRAVPVVWNQTRSTALVTQRRWWSLQYLIPVYIMISPEGASDY